MFGVCLLLVALYSRFTSCSSQTTASPAPAPFLEQPTSGYTTIRQSDPDTIGVISVDNFPTSGNTNDYNNNDSKTNNIDTNDTKVDETKNDTSNNNINNGDEKKEDSDEPEEEQSGFIRGFDNGSKY